MRRFSLKGVILLFGLLWAFVSFGKNVTFVSSDNLPIDNVNCVGYSAQNDSIGMWVSDKKGMIDLKNIEFNYLLASHPGYSEKIIFNKELEEGANIYPFLWSAIKRDCRYSR